MRSWLNQCTQKRGGQLEIVGARPRSFPEDALGLVEPVDGPGERIVIRVADRTDRRGKPGFLHPRRVANRRGHPHRC